MRDARTSGAVTDQVVFQPGLSLQADPDLRPGGQFRSPAGRLLELEVAYAGAGQWIGLHVALAGLNDLTGITWVGLTSRHAAPEELMIRVCLRSGVGNGPDAGFVDCFFDKHILSVPEPLNHVDALYTEARQTLPETLPEIASWRELVLFLPRQNFRWDLHDLRLFAV